jgi:PAP2 superfamily protein
MSSIRCRIIALAATLVFGTAESIWAAPDSYPNDAVLEWNQIALDATVKAGQGPVPQIRTMAIVHVSVHDAVNAIAGNYKTYLRIQAEPAGASPEAAAIAAAHRALAGLFPLQAPDLSPLRAASLAAHGLTEDDPGVAFGDAVAAFILALRASDGAAQALFPYTAPDAGQPGVWVPIGPADDGRLPNLAPAITPGWGKVTPWVLKNGSQFRPGGPPPLGSRRFARDYNEVRDIGSLTSTTRTDEQTEIARFWLASPTAIWNGVARQIVQAQDLDLPSAARTFALLYLAPADASIACWDAKYTFNFWRPITAIRNGDLDDNTHTNPDPLWLPLFVTPQHPEYVSGHSTNSSAMATTLMMLFGDDPGVAIVATSPSNPGFERHWATLSEGVEEVIDARIYSGIHYRTSDEEGARLGRRIARLVVNHALRAAKHWD